MKEKSLAWEIIQESKKNNTKFFIMWLITFIALIGLSIYTYNLQKDIGVIETTEEVTQNNDNGYNNYIGNDGDIVNGNTKDKESN
jgi:heme/copper-type cytochrome/quinol oxidase subunit 2